MENYQVHKAKPVEPDKFVIRVDGALLRDEKQMPLLFDSEYLAHQFAKEKSNG